MISFRSLSASHGNYLNCANAWFPLQQTPQHKNYNKNIISYSLNSNQDTLSTTYTHPLNIRNYTSSIPLNNSNNTNIDIPKLNQAQTISSIEKLSEEDEKKDNSSLFKSLNSVLRKYKFYPANLNNYSDKWISFPDQNTSLINQLKDNHFKNININNDSQIESNNNNKKIVIHNHISSTKDRDIVESLDDLKDIVNSFDSKQYESIFWAQQVLPRAIKCKGNSIKTIVNDCFKYIYPILFLLHTHHTLNESSFKYIISSFVRNEAEQDSLQGRVKIIEKTLLTEIKNARRAIAHSCIKQQDQLDSYHDTQNTTINPPYIVQLCLEQSDTLYISISRANYNDAFGWSLPLPFPGGVYQFPLDKRPPSRAYMKLVELFGLMGGRRPESSVVELGSAPGGWTATLLQMNDQLEIESVDRSPLEEWITQAYKPPRLTHHIANGAVWKPSKPTDWLLNDMALPPQKSLDVLEKWIENKLCKTFVWTLKFVGSDDYPAAINQIKEIMSKHPNVKYIIRHLIHHGNELVIIGSIN